MKIDETFAAECMAAVGPERVAVVRIAPDTPLRFAMGWRGEMTPEQRAVLALLAEAAGITLA